jgi:hypothetical protein
MVRREQGAPTRTKGGNAMEPLVTAEELAGYLRRDLDRYSADLAVTGASGIVRSYCGWNLSRAVETLTVTANGSISVNLPTLRLNDVTEVRADGAVLDPAEYGWGSNGVLAARYRWPLGMQYLAVDVDHGYDPVPDEVRLSCLSMASRLYSNPEGLSSKSSGDDSRVLGDAISDARPSAWEGLELRILHRYRIA